MVHKIALFFCQKPEPVNPQGKQRERDRRQIAPEKIAALPVEFKFLVAEVRMGDHEGVTPDIEDRVIRPQGDQREERAADKELDEVQHPAAERETDRAPRSPAQAVAPRPHPGEGEEHHEEAINEKGGGCLYRIPGAQKLRGYIQKNYRKAEDEPGLERSVK